MTDNLSDRRVVANILRNVRMGIYTVRQAVILYPKDITDESLIAAYHALIHYEADEDIRAKDELYKQEQDDYIEFLSYTLEKGEDLPQNIIENYKQYYDFVPILHQNNPKGFFKSFLKFINVGFKRRN
jgi:hypothetical protein